MRVNEPLTPEQHVQADQAHRELAESQKAFLNEIAALIEKGEPLSSWQRGWAVGAIRGFAKAIPLKRKRPAGRPPVVPEEAIVLRQVYVEGGDTVAQAEEKLASHYGVDLETLQSRIKRLAKQIKPGDWGFAKWGAK